MALASSTTTAAALTVRLDPELVAPSLQPSKPWTCCSCTLDRPEKRPSATLFAGNCTQQRSLRLAAHFQDWLVLGAPGGWCWCWYKVQGLVAGGESGSWEQLEVQTLHCRGLHAPQLQTSPPLQAEARSKQPFGLALSFPTF